MREIKFRAWDERQNRWLKPGEFYYGVGMGKNSHWGFCASGVPEFGLQIVQYTGLKDKNGKEIYEGIF